MDFLGRCCEAWGVIGGRGALVLEGGWWGRDSRRLKTDFGLRCLLVNLSLMSAV